MRRRWTARGAAIAVGLVLLWGGSGVGVYLFLGSHRSDLARKAARPNESAASVNPALARLPGTLFLAQEGALYRLQRGRFTTVLGAAGWAQPAALPGGQGLVLVKRDPSGFSDLYRMSNGGRPEPLTQDQGQGAVQGRDPGGQLVTQYWAMYPRASADGAQLYFATDRYKHVRCCPFDVTMRVAQMPLSGGTPKFWTVDAVTPTDTHTEDGDYAGGDAEPVPLKSGAVMFVRYAHVGSEIGSELLLLKQARGTPVPLTALQDHCSEPALSADGSKVAMICSYGKQTTSLEVAAFDGTSLGPRTIVISGVQAAQPTWSPDGSQLVFLAPVGMTGHFQLWSITAPSSLATPKPAPTPAGRGRTPTPSTPSTAPVPPSAAALPPPIQLTDNLDFDATSPIVWTS